MNSFFDTRGKKGVVQIGICMVNVLYYFTEKDTIYCKITDDNPDCSFTAGEEFFTHYKSLIVKPTIENKIMRIIKIKLEIDGVNMVSSFTEEEYNLIKEKVGLDPLILVVNKLWNEINKHDDLKHNPIPR